jgi:hypothetical protein
VGRRDRRFTTEGTEITEKNQRFFRENLHGLSVSSVLSVVRRGGTRLGEPCHREKNGD